MNEGVCAPKDAIKHFLNTTGKSADDIVLWLKHKKVDGCRAIKEGDSITINYPSKKNVKEASCYGVASGKEGFYLVLSSYNNMYNNLTFFNSPCFMQNFTCVEVAE